jgi:hypothetical protein
MQARLRRRKMLVHCSWINSIDRGSFLPRSAVAVSRCRPRVSHSSTRLARVVLRNNSIRRVGVGSSITPLMTAAKNSALIESGRVNPNPKLVPPALRIRARIRSRLTTHQGPGRSSRAGIPPGTPSCPPPPPQRGLSCWLHLSCWCTFV